MLAIDYYYYAASPFTYLGHDALYAVAEKHRVPVNVKPVILSSLWEHSGAVPPAKRPPMRQRLRLIELQRIAEWRGLPLKPHPRFWPVDTSLADRTVAGLVQSGHDPRYFMGKVFAGVWARDENVADEAVLMSYLSQCGLDAKPALEDAKSPETEAIRIRNTEEAVAADAVGVPCYVLNGEPFWGQDRIELLDRALSTGRSPFRHE